MEKLLEVDNFSLLQEVIGVNDDNLHLLESKFSVQIRLHPQGLIIKGKKGNLQEAVLDIRKLLNLGAQGIFLTRHDLETYLKNSSHDDEKVNQNKHSLDDKSKDCAVHISSTRKEYVFPKTKGQQAYIKAMLDYDITFAIGPAGTGKTYLAMALAVNYLREKKVQRIILTRPAIEAGESLGFLPGDMYDKLRPYLRPLYDAIYEMVDVKMIEDYLEAGVIDIVPLAYMRGRTLNNAFVILDEAQNCTTDQLRMVLTRLGFDSKTVITADITQSDLPGGKPTGLLEAIKVLNPISGIKFINLDKKDVVRHPLIQKIIQAYEDFYSEKTS